MTLPSQGQALGMEQCTCIGAGGDSGAADWGPEPAGTELQHGSGSDPPKADDGELGIKDVNNPAFPQPTGLAKNNPSTTRSESPSLGVGEGEQFNLWGAEQEAPYPGLLSGSSNLP